MRDCLENVWFCQKTHEVAFGFLSLKTIMPTLIAPRHFPLPSISLYTFVSITLLVLSIFWAKNTIYEEQHKLQTGFYDEQKKTLEQNPVVHANETPVEKNNTEESVDGMPGEETHELDEELAYKKVWMFSNADDKESPSTITVTIKKNQQYAEAATEIAKSMLDGECSLAYGIFSLMLVEPLSLILLVNASYCLLALFVQVLQTIVFGKLRPIEAQHMKDKFWNFVFYKFIFVFGVMNVQSLHEALIWVSWFTAIAFLLLLTKLCKDRFEFLSFSPNTPMYFHWKVIGLLVFLLVCCAALTVLSVTYIFPYSTFNEETFDYHSLTFMLTECIIISVKAVHVIMRYLIHLYDIQHEELWERKATLVYHTDLCMELLSLSINFVHHLHMLFSGNIWLSMASLVICMQLRYIVSEIQKRLLRHKNYRRVVANMEAQFPAATREEIAAHEDQCAICWDQMENARKLPCGHLFHSPCLRSWLEQDTTCPTCRKQLGIRNPQNATMENLLDQVDGVGNDGQAPNPAAGVMNAGAQGRRNFWHFDGTRIASWFPSFSVEVTHTPHGAQAMVMTRAAMNQSQVSNSQLDAMVREIQDIFPQIPAQLIRGDLLVTGSVEATSERILDGRIQVPPNQMMGGMPQPTPPPSPLVSEGVQPLPRTEPSPGTSLRRRHTGQASRDDSDMQVTTEQDLPRPTYPFANAPTSSSTPHQGEIPTPQGPIDAPGPSHADLSVGGRFSKAPSERETVLKSRRDAMVRQARLRYLDTRAKQESKTTPSQVSASDTFTIAKFNTNASEDRPSSSSTLLLQDELDLAEGFGRSVTPPSGTAISGLERNADGRISLDFTDSDSSE
uniref:E3 ubiquitin-protein ligase AMFR n=1 Tax=Phallusia mammillata TaxID=59560 RepID=A0A6F9D6Y8_9ASCI|nr:E3 ubiquitin-protein ligase AMFR [Phallusia mammillata]